MDRRDKLAREDGFRNRRESPSFSSSLLDAIYRSIDEPDGESATRKKHGRSTWLKDEEEMERACMVQKWMEKRGDIRRKSMGDCDFDDPMLLNSSSSSCGSSCGARFSSSESDKYFCPSANSSHCTTHRPKPARTSTGSGFYGHAEGGFVRKKSKAFKIYSNLKKVKHPISPGGRLASFLNSLFTAGNAKKANISSSGKLKSDQQQATSTSRSCLSKSTPCSRNNGTKRSVRFCLDEDHHQTSIRKPINKELDWRIMEENRRAVEAAKDVLKNYHKSNNMRGICNSDEKEEDAASCASSDLFELYNLSAMQELPVYETTHLHTNRAIANGLIV
ncbi:hypothetical protein V6N13_063280 [Hibiscus sabdariffa]|uniref:Protein BIG GRAIN 1-like B n=1 Tax=Hibiscus sabdariffa TaxID=183260 RepID=A0ABR2C4R0_9ROSI